MSSHVNNQEEDGQHVKRKRSISHSHTVQSQQTGLLFPKPVPDHTLQVHRWITATLRCTTLPPDSVFEIEAKLGLLVQQDRRVVGAVEGFWQGGGRFVSDMTVAKHAAFNKLLNACVERSASGGARVVYKHTKVVDYFVEGMH